MLKTARATIVSISLDPELDALLSALAFKRRQPRSALVRQLLRQGLQAEAAAARPGSKRGVASGVARVEPRGVGR